MAKDPAPYEVFASKALLLCRDDGADDVIANALVRAYSEHYESNDGPWRLGADAYYDLLESHRIGHQKLKSWINETHVGHAVTATRKGAALFAKMEAVMAEMQP